ncbi:unnamed protein product [Allacma fusca]|uniref:Amine oxidase domain-containing protein n=1 Tax=Allacma fusca TaxID=39272 RepID=A0A8J2PNE5_9HEXA|nr:unnamed protein product [Allacma fusca]
MLLEASNRIGGRVYTVKDEFAGQTETVERGAQWVHGEGSTFTLAKSFGEGLLEDDPFLDMMESNTDFGTSSGKGVTSPALLKTYLELFKTLREGPSEEDSSDISFGNWFLKKIKAKELPQDVHVTAFIHWLERLQTSIDAADSWYESSVRGQLVYANCPGCPTILWTQGYQTLINIILNESPTANDLPTWIKLNSQVTQIDYSNNPIITKTKDGTIFEADAVIVAVSLGVLKSDHGKLFQPPLPPVKVRTIEIWWDPNWVGLNLLWVEEDSMEFPKWATNMLGFYTSKTCPHTLTGWITGEMAREIESIDNKEIEGMIHKILRRFMKNDKIPQPKVTVTKWFTDPLFRGSYSFRSVQSEEQDVWAKDLAEPITLENDTMVCFAGEATHSSFYSTVHGAHDTGIREANRLIRFFTSKPLP